jgi:type IV secretion system protein TrbL
MIGQVGPFDVGDIAKGLGWLVGKAGDVVGGGAVDIASASIKAVAAGIAKAVGSVLEVLGTLWIRLDVPNVWSEQGGQSATVTFLHSEVAVIAGGLAVLGILIGACRLAWEQRAQPGRDLVQGLITLTLVTGCGVPVIGLLVSGSDAVAQSILDDARASTAGDFGANVVAMLGLSGPVLAPMLVIFLGSIAVLVTVLQIGLMVFRAAALVMLAGLLPIAASMTTTQAGREHFKRYVGWVVALAAYKPIAALIYAAAFKLTSTHEINPNGAGSLLIGVCLMTVAVVALPALLKFLVPAIGAISVGAASGGAVGMAGAMAMPTGARMIASHGGAGAVGAAGAAGPSGATAATAAAGPVGAAVAGATVAKQAVDGAAQHATNPTNTNTDRNGGPDGNR